MSLLLEALKKAALEKQSREEQAPHAEQAAEPKTTQPSLGDTLQQKDDVAPVAEPDEQVKNAADPNDEDLLLLDDNNQPIEELEDQNDLEIHSAQQTEEELLFEPEYEETPDQDSLNTQNALEDIDELSGHNDEPGESESHNETEEIAATTGTRTEDIIDEAEIAAAKQQLEQEQILAQRRIEEEQAREEERQRVVKAAEEERVRQEEAEKKRAADIAAQERRRQTTQNRQALDQLIGSGQEIRKKAKRRSAFLYSLLVFTAIGGLSAYYVFLIANTGKTELQVAAPIVESIDDTSDVAELIQMTPDTSLEPEQLNAESNEPLSGDAGASAEAEIMEVIADTAPLSLTGEANPIAIDATNSTPATNGPTIANTTGSSGTIQVAARVDPPPSVTAYLQPLILSANGEAQTENLAERVIVHHKGQPTETSELIREAFDALQANQIEKADRLYQQVLQQKPQQRDALLGAAATATSLGNFDQAMKYYQQRLAAAPNDTYARAGLLGLASSASSRASIQAEVNSLLMDNPRSAQLHFVKGVSLASANEWRSAQSAFYEAYSLDNANPDYAFNLAVSLDHLRQPSLARVYYERAVQLGSNRKTHFDLAAADRRILELSQ